MQKPAGKEGALLFGFCGGYPAVQHPFNKSKIKQVDVKGVANTFSVWNSLLGFAFLNQNGIERLVDCLNDDWFKICLIVPSPRCFYRVIEKCGQCCHYSNQRLISWLTTINERFNSWKIYK